ncbi:unnamed protein product [Symbiodinium natans]|uniref:Peptidase M1 leukotriene A4 hydrolase/aminopeptidase C-terminal domain-containing protein n=1 Tax=Symbiodinium natans TaxID=878477 RepID=A0A812T0J7_9DINO|nr:unnamed protein product [Symbiodinium natans]
MLNAVEPCLVQAWLGISDCAQSWADRWLCSGLEQYALHCLRQQVYGHAASMLQVSLAWRAFCRARQQLPAHSADKRPRCTIHGWMKRLGELKELVGGDLVMYFWLGQSITADEAYSLLRQLRRKFRESPASEEVVLALLRTIPGLHGYGEWPSDDWCAKQLQIQLNAMHSLAEVCEVEKVARAWQNIIPVEVVGGDESKLNKLIIRTAVHVKVKWTVLQQLFFLDLIQDSTCLYRESVVHIGNAYGFNSSRNLDVLHRWCLLLIKHNCQDHVGVLEMCLRLRGELACFFAIFSALVERGRSETRWKFITQHLWDSMQAHMHPMVQSHIFHVLDRGGCIGSF